MAIIVQHIEDRPGNHDKSDPYPYISIALLENSLTIRMGATLMAERSTAGQRWGKWL